MPEYRQIPKDFKIRAGGTPFGKEPPPIKNCIKLLDTLPFKELVTIHQLIGLLKIPYNTFKTYGGFPELSDYRYRDGRCNYWGSKRTIAALRKQME